ESVVAVRLGGSLITRSNPAKPLDEIVLFGTGLGETNPATPAGRVTPIAAPLQQSAGFQVLFDGMPARVRYVGAAPGFAGLYQINVQLPSSLGTNPEVRVSTGDRVSPGGLMLPVAGNI